MKCCPFCSCVFGALLVFMTGCASRDAQEYTIEVPYNTNSASSDRRVVKVLQSWNTDNSTHQKAINWFYQQPDGTIVGGHESHFGKAWLPGTLETAIGVGGSILYADHLPEYQENNRVIQRGASSAMQNQGQKQDQLQEQLQLQGQGQKTTANPTATAAPSTTVKSNVDVDNTWNPDMEVVNKNQFTPPPQQNPPRRSHKKHGR